MAYIPEDKLLEIKEAAAIEEVVGQYVKLEQRGRNLLGLCPFHSDTKPSFTVAPDKGIFHCFGCNTGGNVFSFVMQYHRLSFPEAVEELAKRYGIPLTRRDLGQEGARQARRRLSLQEVTDLAATFYTDCLRGKEGRPGRDYLKKRGLTPEIVKEYRLGYAPNAWDSLSRHLQGQRASLEAAQEAGLLSPRPQGGYYDRFRDRVIFPIMDRQGRIMAFGGRIVGEGEPKYLNSPESPLYSKGRHLYGVPQAAPALRRDGLALVVEGYLDLLALRVHGVEPVVATLGTALTREQVRLLKSLVDRAVMVFDGDLAGAKAMLRAFPLFAAEGLAVRALPLPPGLDPDTYVFQHGPELFQAPWEAAQPWFTYVLEHLIAAHGLDIEGRVRIIEALRPYYQAMAEPVERDLWLKVAAERLGVSEAPLRQSLAFPDSLPFQEPTGSSLAVNLERGLVKWILHHPQDWSLEELEEWATDFEDSMLQDIINLIIHSCRADGRLDFSLLIQRVPEDRLRQQVCALTLAEEEVCGSTSDRLAADCRLALRRRRLQRSRQALKEKLAQAAAHPGGDDIVALQAQKQEIDRQLEALKSGF